MEAATLVFIGFMGAGKTSAARAAAGLLGARAIDADHEIERPCRRTISSSRSTTGSPEAWASECAAVVLPAPMKPTSTTWRSTLTPMPRR